MPFLGDTAIIPAILAGMQQGGSKVFNDWHPGHAPVVNSNSLTDILTKLGGFGAKQLSPLFPSNTIPGQGTMAPDSPKLGALGKEWNDQSQQQPSSIFDQLIALALGGGQSDTSQFSNAAHAAANAQYDPQIADLRRLMGITENRANTNKVQLGNMYSSLSAADKADIPQIDRMFAQGGQQVGAQYDKMQGQTDQAYQPVS